MSSTFEDRAIVAERLTLASKIAPSGSQGPSLCDPAER